MVISKTWYGKVGPDSGNNDMEITVGKVGPDMAGPDVSANQKYCTMRMLV
jgi:hypothetical protein